MPILGQAPSYFCSICFIVIMFVVALSSCPGTTRHCNFKRQLFSVAELYMTPKRSTLSWYLDRFSPPEALLLLILSVIVGASTGLASVLFVKLIYAIQDLSYGGISSLLPFVGKWIYLIVPILGGLLVGPLILMAQEAKGHGVPEVMQALILQGGRIRARVAAAKITASALCIGTGGSAGREGPIIQVGAALGSSLGQILRLSDERIRNLVACGAAAGIAATFNAPIAGVAFAIEVLMCGLQMRAFGNVVIAAVSASVVSRSLIGNKFAFEVPSYSLHSSIEIVFYLLLGLTAALVGIMFMKMLDYLEDVFDNWKFPQLFKPATGGLLLGIVGLLYMNLPNLTFPAGSAAHGAGMEVPIPHMYGAGFPFYRSSDSGQCVSLAIDSYSSFSNLLRPAAPSVPEIPAVFLRRHSLPALCWVVPWAISSLPGFLLSVIIPEPLPWSAWRPSFRLRPGRR